MIMMIWNKWILIATNDDIYDENCDDKIYLHDIIDDDHDDDDKKKIGDVVLPWTPDKTSLPIYI